MRQSWARVGNCFRLSMVCLIRLIDKEYQGNAELISFRHLDHTFLVLNRPESTDWKQWGDDCIIIDPWLNEIITADKFGKFWSERLELLKPPQDLYDNLKCRNKRVKNIDQIRNKIPIYFNKQPNSPFDVNIGPGIETFRAIRNEDKGDHKNVGGQLA